MGTTTTTTTKVSVYTGEADKLKDQIASYQKLLADKENAIKDAQQKIAENTKLAAEYEELEQSANDVAEKIKNLDLKEKTTLDATKIQYDQANGEINASLDKTKVMPEQVVDFLRLTNKIIPTVSKQNGDTQKLIGSIESLHFFLDRDCNAEARIKDANALGAGRYERLAIILNQNTLNLCSEIEGDQKWCDESVIPILKEGITAATNKYNELKDDENKDDEFLTKKAELEKLKVPWIIFDERKVNQVVVSPRKWKDEQTKQLQNNKRELDTFCPIMVKFFNAANSSIKLARQLLEINTDLLNEAQKKALESAPKDDEKDQNVKAIEEAKENKDSGGGGGDEDDKKQIELLKKKAEKEENDMLDFSGISTIVNNKELSNEIDINSKLINIAIQNLEIVGSADFKDIFEKNTTAKVFAVAVEDALLQMMKCQGAERGQILLAKKILRMKPANVDIDTNKFWQALDDGLVQIFVSVGTMDQVSEKFFGFFLRFLDSFDKYTKFGQDISYIQTDLNDFLKFKEKYGEQLRLLSNNALKTIVQCIKQNIGDLTIQTALANVEKLKTAYDNALDAYNIAYSKHLEKYFEKAKIAAEMKGQKEKAKNMVAFYTKFIKDTENDKQIQAKIDELNKQLKDPKTSNYELVDKKVVKET